MVTLYNEIVAKTTTKHLYKIKSIMFTFMTCVIGRLGRKNTRKA